jgi:hypothetical protein
MRYMLLIYSAEQAWSQGELEACYVESAGIARDLAANGHYVAASPLRSISTATSVKMRDGSRFVTDGPFAETREQLGGYYIVDVNDLDEAIEIASRIPAAKKGTVEIRPVLEIEGLPDVQTRSTASTPSTI